MNANHGDPVPGPSRRSGCVGPRRLTPHFEPQALDRPRRKAHYADTNFHLLGAVLEAVTGERIACSTRSFSRRWAWPTRRRFRIRPGRGPRPSPDVAVWSKDVVLRISGALATQRAKGGIVSTVTDQLRFMSALVGGEVFSDPSTWNRMTSRFHRVIFPVDYGLGVMRYAPPR